MTVESVSARSMLRTLLEQLAEPCWALDATGKVRIVNAAARSAHPEPPAFLAAIARDEPSVDAVDLRVRRVSLDAETWTIVFGQRARRGPDTATLLGLDANDAEIVDHLASGFSDRELVLLTGRPIATVQASITRAFRALGVSSRAELLSSLSRARLTAAASSRRTHARSDSVPKNPALVPSRTGTSDER